MSEKLYKSQFTLITLVLAICALIFLTIGITTPLWHRSTNGPRSVDYGMFYKCTSDDSINMCDDHGIDADWHRIVQSLEIIGIFLLFMCVVVILLNMFLMSGLLVIYSIVAAAMFITGLCVFIGAIIYGSQVNGNELHFSFAISIVAAFLIIAAAVFLLISIKVQEKCYYQTKHSDRDSVAGESGKNYLKTKKVACRSNKISPYTVDKKTTAKKHSRGGCTCCCLNTCCYGKQSHASIMNEEDHKTEEITITRDTNNTFVFTNDRYIQNKSYNAEIHAYDNRVKSNAQQPTNNTHKMTNNIYDTGTRYNIKMQTNGQRQSPVKYANESQLGNNVSFCPCIMLHGDIEGWKSLQNHCTCGCCDLGNVKYPVTDHITSNVKSTEQNVIISGTKTKKNLKTGVTENVYLKNDKGMEQYGKKRVHDNYVRNEMKSKHESKTKPLSEHRILTPENERSSEASVSNYKADRCLTSTRDPVASYSSRTSEKAPEAQNAKAAIPTRRRLSSNDDSNESNKVHNQNSLTSKSIAMNEIRPDSFDSFTYEDVNTHNSFLDSPVNVDSPDYKGRDISLKGNKKTSVYSRHSTNDDTLPNIENDTAKSDTLDENTQDLKIFRHRKAVVHTPKIMETQDDIVYLAEQPRFHSPTDEASGKGDDISTDNKNDTTLDPQGVQDINDKLHNCNEFKTNFHQELKESQEKIKQKPENAKRTKKTKPIKWTPGKPWRSIF